MNAASNVPRSLPDAQPGANGKIMCGDMGEGDVQRTISGSVKDCVKKTSKKDREVVSLPFDGCVFRVNFLLVGLFLLGSFFIGSFAGCDHLPETSRLSNEPIRTVAQWNQRHDKTAVTRIVCSGPGALRLVTYLGCAEKVVAVEQMEHSTTSFAPYRLFHPEFKRLPVFGEGHGRDNIEALLAMNPKPDLLIRVDNPGSGIDPAVVQERTQIPVILIPYGNFGPDRPLFDQSIRFLGAVLDRQERAEQLLTFIDAQIAELDERTRELPDENRPSVFLGGLSWRGAHGINSTMTNYPPFDWLHLNNLAAELDSQTVRANHATVSKEQIVAWNPDFLLIDLGTLGLAQSNALEELTTQSIYRSVKALQKDQVFSLCPNNSYGTNFESMLLNAWFIGKTTMPERFLDIELAKKAEEIGQMFFGTTLQDVVPKSLTPRCFQKISLEKPSQPINPEDSKTD